MNEFEHVFGTGHGIGQHWTSPAELSLAETGVAETLWLDFDSDLPGEDGDWETEPDTPGESGTEPAIRPVTELLFDIPLAVDHRTVLAQDPAEPVSRPPWLAGN